MTAENTTRTRTTERAMLRRKLSDLHSRNAKNAQRIAPISVGKGARWRSAIASANPVALWCVKGRMMNAGIKNNAILTTAENAKKSHKMG